MSAYNDRFNNSNWGTGNTQIEWFRKDRSFSSFANLVLHQYRRSCFPNNTQASRIRTNWSNANCQDKVNCHWRPFAFECAYCDIDYDLIGRMEKWNDDLNYIVRKRGLEKVLKVKKADTKSHTSKVSTKEMTKEYFDTLSQKQKEDLYHMFRLDFEMFNYDPKIYL